jgi:hypothetical protein
MTCCDSGGCFFPMHPHVNHEPQLLNFSLQQHVIRMSANTKVTPPMLDPMIMAVFVFLFWQVLRVSYVWGVSEVSQQF